jgi:hypothetical protein
MKMWWMYWNILSQNSCLVCKYIFIKQVSQKYNKYACTKRLGIEFGMFDFQQANIINLKFDLLFDY